MTMEMNISKNEIDKSSNHYAEYIKCQSDPIYFIENYVKIFNPSMGLVNFKMYDKQKEFIIQFLQDHYVVVNKSRQTGMSTINKQLMLWLVTFFNHYNAGVISLEQEESSYFLEGIKEMWETLPKWLQVPIVIDNRKTKKFKNGSILKQSGQSKNPFRGKTMGFIMVDEQANVPNLDLQIMQLAPTLSRIQKSGLPYGIIFNSTPTDTTTYYYKKYQQQLKKTKQQSRKENSNSLIPVFTAFTFHWSEVPEFDENWYRAQCEILDNDPIKIQQELDLQFVNNNTSFIPSEILSNIYTSNPIDFLNINNYIIKIFQGVQQNETYTIGVDVSEQRGVNYSTVEVIKDSTLEQVQEFQDNTIPRYKLQELIYLLGQRYNNQLVQVENNIGMDVLMKLQELNYPNLYYDENISQDKKQQKWGQINVNNQNTQKLQLGINTNSRTRSIMINNLYNVIYKYYKETLDKKDNNEFNFKNKYMRVQIIKSAQLKEELKNFSYINGKYKAPQGLHDDLLFQFIFQLWQNRNSIKVDGIEKHNLQDLDLTQFMNRKTNLNQIL